jgi:hypothetical protein
MKTSHLLAFLGGAVTGGIIALLTTPKTGAENRALVAEKIKQGSDLTKRELQELGNWIKEQLQNENFVEETGEQMEE